MEKMTSLHEVKREYLDQLIEAKTIVPVSDYDDLENRPKLNGITITGDHILGYYGIAIKGSDGNLSFGSSKDVASNVWAGESHGIQTEEVNDGGAIFGKYGSSPTDALFSVANGTGSSNLSTAFNVYKDGTIEANASYVPTADNHLATKKYVDENGGGGESLIGTYEVDYETVAIGSIFDGLGTSVCFMGDVTGSEGNLNNKIITRIEGTLDGETYQDINAIALFNDGNYGSLIHKPYVRTEGGETFTAIWQSKESCSMGIENIASIKVYGTEATE